MGNLAIRDKIGEVGKLGEVAGIGESWDNQVGAARITQYLNIPSFFDNFPKITQFPNCGNIPDLCRFYQVGGVGDVGKGERLR